MAQQLLTKGDFAALAGVSAPAVTKALRGALADALVGKRIDAEHPAAVAYCRKRTSSRRKGAGGRPRKEPKQEPIAVPTPVTLPGSEEQMVTGVPEDIQELLNWTILEVVSKFGTMSRFSDYLAAVERIERISDRRLKNAKEQGKLVFRESVQNGIVGPIDGAHVQLLTDGKKTIAARGEALVKAGGTVHELESLVSEQITAFLKPAVARMRKWSESNK